VDALQLERQLASDRDALREIVAGLERVEGEVRQAQEHFGAAPRGYFTPDEDDRVRQLLCSYRGLRIGCYEILQRWWDFADLPDRERALEAFLVGYATAISLYAKSLTMIQSFERDPLVRSKLNEPDSKFDLEPLFFESMIEAYSSTTNLVALSRAHFFWIRRRRDVKRLVRERPEEWKWVVDIVREKLPRVRKRFWSVIFSRLRHDWRGLLRTLRWPLLQTRFGLQSLVGGAVTDRAPDTRGTFALQAMLDRLRASLAPGDVLLVRTEGKLTTALIPGFWAHAAIFFGGRPELEKLGLARNPFVKKHWERVPADPGTYGQVIEAVSPRVTVHALEQCLEADHVAVLRPRVSADERAQALAEAFGHLDKAYDFEFDFNASSRIVCTELVWRAFHRRGGIDFKLVKRLGRFTLSPDDIVEQLLAARAAGTAPFEIVALALREHDGVVRWREQRDAERALRAVSWGWRPATAPYRSAQAHGPPLSDTTESARA
jgi:hypothetical protein